MGGLFGHPCFFPWRIYVSALGVNVGWLVEIAIREEIVN